jgi:hypothetical protein
MDSIAMHCDVQYAYVVLQKFLGDMDIFSSKSFLLSILHLHPYCRANMDSFF